VRYLLLLLVLLSGCVSTGQRTVVKPRRYLPSQPPPPPPGLRLNSAQIQDDNLPPVASITVVSTNAVIPEPTGVSASRWFITNSVLTILYHANSNQFYGLQWTSNLVNWSFLSGAMSDGGEQSFGVTINNTVGLPPTVFLRIVTGPAPTF
jgi:hypothetical protein